MTEVCGDGEKVLAAKLENTKSKEISKIDCSGVFVAIGHEPNTKIFQNKLQSFQFKYSSFVI